VSGKWKLIFTRSGDIQKILKDASEARIVTSRSFLEELKERIERDARYRTDVLGIVEVEGADGIRRGGEHYFVIVADFGGKKVQLLFELTEGEASRLVACNLERISQRELKKVVDAVAEGREVGEVRLII